MTKEIKEDVDTWSCIMLLEYLLEYDDGVGICLGYQSREMIEAQLKRLKNNITK